MNIERQTELPYGVSHINFTTIENQFGTYPLYIVEYTVADEQYELELFMEHYGDYKRTQLLRKVSPEYPHQYGAIDWFKKEVERLRIRNLCKSLATDEGARARKLALDKERLEISYHSAGDIAYLAAVSAYQQGYFDALIELNR